MTIIAVCTLVLNVIVAVLLAVYGVWFNNVVKHQLGAKDATIETLKTEIDSLKGDRAPAIAAEHKIMKEFADQMAAQKQQLEDQVKTLTTSQKAMVNSNDRFIGETEGMKKALRTIVMKYIAITMRRPTKLPEEMNEVFMNIFAEIKNREGAPPTHPI
jgi:hypothetical protein